MVGKKIVHYLLFMVYVLSLIIDLWDRCEIVYNWKVKFIEENMIDMKHTHNTDVLRPFPMVFDCIITNLL